MKEYVWYIHENNELFVSNESPIEVLSQDIVLFLNKKPSNRRIRLSNNSGDIKCHIEQNDGINISYIGEL